MTSKLRSRKFVLIGYGCLTSIGILILHAILNALYRLVHEDDIFYDVSKVSTWSDWNALISKEDLLVEQTKERNLFMLDQQRIKLIIVIAFPAFQAPEVIENLRSWTMSDYSPCIKTRSSSSSSSITQHHVEVLLTVSNQDELNQIRSQLEDTVEFLTSMKVVSKTCIQRIRISHSNLSQEENEYKWAPPTMFHNAFNNTELIQDNFTHLMWMEGDTWAVRKNWIIPLVNEAKIMSYTGSWMRGSTQLHNRGWRRNNEDRSHINGNALFNFNSEAFRIFLRGSRIGNPNVFDYAIHEWRWRDGDLTNDFEAMEWHVQMTTKIAHRFQYSKFIQNHPVDLCMPDLQAFLERHSSTIFVHGRPIGRIVLGSQCCSCFPEDFQFWKMQRLKMSEQYKCLYADQSVFPKRSTKKLSSSSSFALSLSEIHQNNEQEEIHIGEGDCTKRNKKCTWGSVCDVDLQKCVQICKEKERQFWKHDPQTLYCLCTAHSMCVSGTCTRMNRCKKETGPTCLLH